MKKLLMSAKPVIIAVAAAILTSLYAVPQVQPARGDWRSQFKRLIPSLNCVLGRKSCSEQQIHVARAKVRAYVALFGTAVVAYGIRAYMSGKKETKRGGMDTGSVFKERADYSKENEGYKPVRYTGRVTPEDLSVDELPYSGNQAPQYEPREAFGAAE